MRRAFALQWFVAPLGACVNTTAVGQPFQRVAMLASSGSSGWTTATGMLNSQRQRAAQLGAKVAGAVFGTGTQRTGDAMVVYVPGDTASITQLCDGPKNRRTTTATQ